MKPYQEDPDRLDPLPGVAKHVMKVIAKSLAKEQTDRFTTARQFTAALKEALAHKPSLWERIFK